MADSSAAALFFSSPFHALPSVFSRSSRSKLAFPPSVSSTGRCRSDRPVRSRSRDSDDGGDPYGPYPWESSPSSSSDGENVSDVKTSEYKTFKRLLEKINSERRPFHHANRINNLKLSEASHCMEEENNSSHKCNVNRTLLPIQKVTPTVLKTSMIPPTISQNCELYRSKSACSSLLPIQNATPIARMSCRSPDISPNYGPANEYGGIFQEKRKHLLLLAAEASSQIVDDIILNKAEVISKLLQRLGNGRKSSNLHGLPKSEQKLSSSRCDSLAPSGSYDSMKELKDYSRLDVLPTWRKDMDKELLGYRCNEAGKSITWQLDNVDDQEFTAWRASIPGCQPQRWLPQLVFNEKKNSDLLAESRSLSAVELDKFGAGKDVHHTSGHSLSKSEEIFTYPWDYVDVQALPSLDTLNICLQGTGQHLNTFENVDNRHISRVYHSLNGVQSKAMVQAIPSLWCPNSSLLGERWRLSSVSDEGITETTSASKGYSIMDRVLPRANERTALSRNDKFKVFPTSHELETALQSRNWHSSSVLGVSDFNAENRLVCTSELNMNLEHGKSGLDATNDMQLDVGCVVSYNYPSCCHLTEQKVVPYIHSSSSLSYGSSSPDFESVLGKDQSTFPLMQWNDEFEPELPSASNRGLPKEMNCLPLALYTAPDPPYEADSFRLPDLCRRRVFCSPRSSPLVTIPPYEADSIRLPDLCRRRVSCSPISSPLVTIPPYEADSSRLPDLCRRRVSCSPRSSPLVTIPGLKLKQKRSPIIFDGEPCSSMGTNFRYDEQETGGLHFTATEGSYHGCEDRKGLMEEVQAHIPADFPPLGLEFSLDRKSDIFGFLPEKLSWC